ncbi:hypothetical protein TL16_g02820 [Triparma laevis f. inornata]|uniref:Metallo-beta-lactamase domain-containing protein n=1 Tax=Triparma laevis f. inornata TaxID=1714386 RepID=A0A9W7DYE9_9STRA|nr:hypothetical protein TL16_g02820 [Triparma laevis f. inornata]
MGACASSSPNTEHSISTVRSSSNSKSTSLVSTLGALPTAAALTKSKANVEIINMTKLQSERAALSNTSGRFLGSNMHDMINKGKEEDSDDEKHSVLRSPTDTATTARDQNEDNASNEGSAGSPKISSTSAALHQAYSDLHTEVRVDGHKTFLPRGGVLVRTESDDNIDIQFGIPPETIKDSMSLGYNVPQYFVIGVEMFDRIGARSLAEFEFPAYFNFFCLKRQVTIICRKYMKDSIRKIFTETLLGPSKKHGHIYHHGDFPPATDPSCFPNFDGEGNYLDPARKTLTIDHLLKLIEFDSHGIARIPESKEGVSVKIDEHNQSYLVRKLNPDGKQVLLAEVPENIKADETNDSTPNLVRKLEYQPLNVPNFGVTILGASHGFDPSGTTTGFVIWSNGRGMMVDPPPGSSKVLKKLSIPSRSIDGVILTHCHADHDAGTFQRILEEQNVRLYTTTTIFRSFLRKYCACTGLDQEFLQKCLTFVPCVIGQVIPFHGLGFKFFYSMHTIPCIGFEVFGGAESIIYSADTNADPELPGGMFKDGVVGEGRKNALMNNALSGNHTVIFHEAGVPPIHTPMDLLAKQPDHVKERMFLVHVSENKVPKNVGLKVAKEWSTMSIGSSNEESTFFRSKKHIMQKLSCTELFCNVSHADFEEHIIPNTQKIKLARETTLFVKGDPVSYVYYVIAGRVRAKREGTDLPPYFYGCGDIVFASGEASFSACTETAVFLYKVDKVAVGHAVKDDANVVRMLRQLTKVMNTNVWEMLSSNLTLKNSSMEMLVEFSSILSEEKLLEPGTLVDCEWSGFLVTSGSVHFLLDATICDSDQEIDDMLPPDIPEVVEEGNEEDSSGMFSFRGSPGQAGATTDPLDRGRSRFKRSTGGKKTGELQAEVISSPNFLSGTIELLAKSGSLRSVSSSQGGTTGKSTFRGSKRSLFIDEEAYAGTIIMDMNAFLLQESSNIQCESITEAKVRTFERHEMLQFLHKYPGLMVRLLDSVMSNSKMIYS